MKRSGVHNANAPASLDFRFERKYRITGVAPSEIESWVLNCPSFFRKAYEPRYINNIYLDTTALGNYFQNLAGVANRTKIRVRWYGKLFGDVKSPKLEYKIKRGMLGVKEIYPLVDFRFDRGFGTKDLELVFSRSDLKDRVRKDLSFVRPFLVNRYHRKYFISANREYRITLDTEMDFYRFASFDNQFLVKSSLPDDTVMELKYSGTIRDLDDSLMNYFPHRVTRMSKYVVGLEAVEL